MPAFLYERDERYTAGSAELLLPGRFSAVRGIAPGAVQTAESIVAHCARDDRKVAAFRLPISEKRLNKLLEVERYKENILANFCTPQRVIAEVALKGSKILDISPRQDGSRHLMIEHPHSLSPDAALPPEIGWHNLAKLNLGNEPFTPN